MPWEKTLKGRYLNLNFYNFWNSIYSFQQLTFLDSNCSANLIYFITKPYFLWCFFITRKVVRTFGLCVFFTTFFLVTRVVRVKSLIFITRPSQSLQYLASKLFFEKNYNRRHNLIFYYLLNHKYGSIIVKIHHFESKMLTKYFFYYLDTF